MYPEMLVPTINLVVYNEGGEPLTMTGYRLQKTSPENDAPISVLHHRLVEREANIDITEGLFQAVAGSPPMTRNLSTTPSSAL